jgi:hypothetical protein
MIPISSAISGGLTWSKSSRKHGYELIRNGGTVASLQRTSCWSPEYQAESPHGKWRFRRTGFWRAAMEIVDSSSGVQIAALKPNWGGGGTLVFSDGQAFHISCRGLWRPVWSVLAENGQPVLRIHSREKTVEVPDQALVPEDRLILLATFAWYVMQQAAEDAASAAVVVAATS